MVLQVLAPRKLPHERVSAASDLFDNVGDEHFPADGDLFGSDCATLQARRHCDANCLPVFASIAYPTIANVLGQSVCLGHDAPTLIAVFGRTIQNRSLYRERFENNGARFGSLSVVLGLRGST